MISREKWGQIIRDWQTKKLPVVVTREKKILPSQNIQRAVSIIGPRRAGKTYTMYLLIKELIENNGKDTILYINFERADLGIISYPDLVIMLEVYFEIFPENKKENIWLFLDELQNVSEWERFVRTCLDEGIKVYISGSSSKLLSKEIATSMRGRNLSHILLPFSFREYLSAMNFTRKNYYSSDEHAQVIKYFNDYLVWGGYPESVLFPQDREKVLRDIFETAILKDVAERNNIRNIALLKNFVKALLISHEFSINKFYNYLKSQQIKVGKNVLYSYLEYLEDAFFVYSMRKFNLSYKKPDQSIPKIYFIDNGLLSISGIDDKGRLLENLVYIELLRKEYFISYYQNELKEEVDFLLLEGKRVKKLIQVCYDMQNFMTRDREIRILIKASNEFKCDSMLIITMNEEGEEKINGKTIKILPAWKWLLSEDK